MGDGVEVEVWKHGRQGCLVACVRTEPSTEKGVQTRQTQPDVPPEYRTHRMQSPHYQSQDETPPNLTQDGFLLMYDNIASVGSQEEDVHNLSLGDEVQQLK